MKAIYLLLIATALFLASCRAKKGDPGPVGTTGTVGATGTSTPSLIKQGFFTGTLDYFDYKGSPVKPSFKYEYYSTEKNNFFIYENTPDYKYFEVFVYRKDISDSHNKLSFYLKGSVDEKGLPIYEEFDSHGRADFSYVGLIDNNIFAFDDYNYNFNHNLEESPHEVPFGGDRGYQWDIKNFSLDTLTGRLRFDFTTEINSSDIWDTDRNANGWATLSGSMDVVLKRKRSSRPIE